MKRSFRSQMQRRQIVKGVEAPCPTENKPVIKRQDGIPGANQYARLQA